MKLKVGELRVHYAHDNLDVELDRALEQVLVKFGYCRWASGYDLTEDVRDLAFRLECKDDDSEAYAETEVVYGNLKAYSGDPRDKGFQIG